jgi:hypothetical protein
MLLDRYSSFCNIVVISIYKESPPSKPQQKEEAKGVP